MTNEDLSHLNISIMKKTISLNMKAKFLKQLNFNWVFFWGVLLFSNQAFSQTAYGPFFDFSCSDTYEDIGGQSVSSINPNGLNLTNKKIFINGVFTVDRNLVMFNCKIKMGPNAQIVTSGNVLLFASKTVFSGCNSPWLKIEIKPGAKFRFSTCLFRDAKEAALVVASGYSPTAGTTNWIRDCVFVNDNIGISAVGQHQFVNLTPMSFYGNRFLKETGSPTGIPSITMIEGIHLANCNWVIGSTGTINLFDHGENPSATGIWAIGSTLKVSNCEFTDLFQDYTTTFQKGVGIYAKNSNLIVKQELGYNKCVFKRNKRAGILTYNMRHLNVSGADFIDNEKWAIRSEDNDAPAQIIIENNFVQCNQEGEQSGFFIVRPVVSNETFPNSSIYNNKIFLQAGRNDFQRGIEVRSYPNTMNKMVIEKNEIHFAKSSYQAHGILVTGANTVRGYKILNNKIYYESPNVVTNENDNTYSSWGIGLVSANSGETSYTEFINEIRDNLVNITTYSGNMPVGSTEANPNSVVLCGIHVRNCPYTRVKNNTVNNAFRDFHMWFDNNHCDFACNTMGFSNFGLVAAGAAVSDIHMDDQNQKGNKWPSSYAVIDALAKTDAAGQPAVNIDFKFKANPDIQYHFPAQWLPVDWFQVNYDPVAECGSRNEPPIYNDLRKYLSSLQTNLINGTQPADATLARLWDHKRDLCLALFNTPLISSEFPIATTWLNAQIGTSGRLFANADQNIKNAMIFPATTEAQLIALFAQRSQYFSQMQSLTTSLENGTPDSIAVSMLIQLKTDSLCIVTNQIDTIINQTMATRQSQLTTVSGQVNNLPDTAMYEFARKKLFGFQIKTLKGDTLTSSEIVELTSISKGCFFDLGSTVQDAQLLLPADIQVKFLTDEHVNYENCTDRNAISNKNDRYILSKVAIFPNPALDYINAKPLAQDLQISKWQIVDILGHQLLSGKGTSSNIRIDIKQLSVGIYTFSGTLDNGAFFYTAFTIQR
jgi:hypothetical protein